MMFPNNVTDRLDPNGDPLWRRKDSSDLFGHIEAKGDSDLFKCSLKSGALEECVGSNGSKPTAKRWEGRLSTSLSLSNESFF